MKKILYIFIAIFMLFTLTSTVYAKRTAPKDVPPILHEGVRYTVNHDKRGIIEAWDANTNKLLWEKQIYNTEYDGQLEQDVQDVFITHIYIEGQTLWIQNENEKTYTLDLTNQQVHNYTDTQSIPTDLTLSPTSTKTIIFYIGFLLSLGVLYVVFKTIKK
ncbi:MAG: hypothetical protein CO029_01715 [Candidatus Magasanikbacteria bacterium CG_4_9_14_0_2_um_filter_41_10]|uniref:Uncharacterized protein n=1 Tax=Candidatus Magasanikbacteria bacterium CG_4_10_14_0_2_um_filter_41_31 TaxID=1974639 RepID=A0A2M7V4A4_9BACT|nr:MAG: hypothetical protein AUJ37_00765 [Candidatus Magasanikbacteria bacterium CG1_02_41_34]PIZ93355.1 MAG: hypothetical protein COX83_02230 [Candidatus Magasanikbacteria bacterium CG_4_10_14_0_2_um_filter_41_31]PJC53642.1 MAG: hypothetical protein CO029_01715 [Candidatus Magasanikbacteria bacterium CG_4_9_14_0_2_um_filter_41_10]